MKNFGFLNRPKQGSRNHNPSPTPHPHVLLPRIPRQTEAPPRTLPCRRRRQTDAPLQTQRPCCLDATEDSATGCRTSYAALYKLMPPADPICAAYGESKVHVILSFSLILHPLVTSYILGQERHPSLPWTPAASGPWTGIGPRRTARWPALHPVQVGVSDVFAVRGDFPGGQATAPQLKISTIQFYVHIAVLD